jgi:hypothetical protein
VSAVDHDARLRAATGVSLPAVVDHILQVWGRATPSDVEAGARWYVDGGLLVAELAASHGLSAECVAAVVAHLSPRTHWALCVAHAVTLLNGGDRPAGCMSASWERAVAAFKSSDPLGTLRGPKVRRFALNLLGDREAVTVDVWAARVALGADADTALLLGRRGVYEALEHAFRVAAARVGVDPATMQATTWVVIRNGRAG